MAGCSSGGRAKTQSTTGAKRCCSWMNGHDREKHDEQRGERQGLVERMPDAVLLGDAGERRREHDQREADEADGCDVEREPRDKQQGRCGLHDEHGAIVGRSIVAFGARIVLEHGTHGLRQLGAVPEPAQLLDEQAR